MFFSDDIGAGFTEWGSLHLITIFMIVIGVLGIFVFKDKLKNYKA